MRYLTVLLVAGGLVASLGIGNRAQAQSLTDMILPGVPAPAAPNAVAPAKPVSGATVYLVDRSGNLGTLDLGTRAVHVIFNTHQHLTDIAFSPTGKLYAVSFQLLFQIDPVAKTIRPVGRLGVNGINALVFNAAGECFGASTDSTTLYRINVATGRATAIGSNGRFRSAGDLAFFQHQLLLTSTDQHLVALSPVNGSAGTTISDGIKDLFGLISPNTSELDAFSFTKAYRYNPATKKFTVLFDFGGKGLGKIFGAAFNGNFRP